MATITVRNLDDAAYERLKDDAKANRRSLEAEARARLSAESISPAAKAARAAALDRLLAVSLDPGPDYEGSVALIRAIRDEE
uniref:FitA-like ribbon-helix-helix domain-containing protein n=1 Tax=uncultured Sphingomonas sp. TaxID=158754 RepID=UPI0035CA6EC1